MGQPKYLEIWCGFCPWQHTLIWESDENPEKSARGTLRDHIGTCHTSVELAIFDAHVATHSLSEISNWTKATRDDLD